MNSTPNAVQNHIYDFLCSIIEQAVLDYRQLTDAGYIVNGQPTALADQLTVKKTAFGMTKIDIQDLIRFLNSASFDRMCRDGLRIEIDPVAVKERLGLSIKRQAS
jgi:hypothetical protein